MVIPLTRRFIQWLQRRSRACADEDEEVENEDIPTRADTPTSSAFDVSAEKSQADATPLNSENQTGSRLGDDFLILSTYRSMS